VINLAQKNTTSKVRPELAHAYSKYIEIFHADEKNGYSVVMNWIAFYNHRDSSGKVPTDEGLCMNMCREIKEPQ